MSHIRVNGLEGHYTIKRLKKLPKRGNSNWLYTLEKDHMSVYYIWTLNNEYEKICIADSLSFATSIEAGANITITGTGTDLDPYIINAIPETAAETPVTPVGNIESTNVQDALEELQTDIDIISVQSDWDQTDNTQPDFIQNKPTNTSEFTNDGSDGTSLYVEEDNPILPRIVSGLLDSNTGIATFTRDDATTFPVDFSSFLSGSSVTLQDTITDASTDGVESNAIFDTINNDNEQGLQNSLFANASIRGVSGVVFGLGTLVYDRDIILARTFGSQFFIVNNALPGFEEFKATQDSRWRVTVFNRSSDNSGMPILQNFYSNELRSSVGETLGVPANYTAYAFNNAANPWFNSDFDITDSNNALVTMSMTFSPAATSGSGTTVVGSDVDLGGTLNKNIVINMGDPDDSAFNVQFAHDGAGIPTLFIEPDNMKFESGDSLLQITGNSTKMTLGGIPTVVGQVPIWTNTDGTLGAQTIPIPQSVTFTPVLTDLGGGATYAGNYTGQGFKIGDWFWFNIFCFSITTTGTPTGNFVITGFPELIATTTPVTVGQFLGTGTTPDFDMITGIIGPSGGQSQVTFNIKPANSGTPDLIALQDVVFGTANAAINISGAFLIQ